MTDEARHVQLPTLGDAIRKMTSVRPLHHDLRMMLVHQPDGRTYFAPVGSNYPGFGDLPDPAWIEIRLDDER